MSFCSACGKEVSDGGKLCASCGTPIPGGVGAGAATKVMLESKRGGRLALKGLGLAVLIGVIANLTLSKTANAQMLTAWRAVAFGIGAAYIITNLRKWGRQKQTIKGAGIAWTVSALLIVGCIGSLMDISPRVPSTQIDTNTNAVSSKGELLQTVKLDYKWSKEGFGSIMIADFTVHNPTRYRFKDFEIKCTHFAPSGTEIDSNTRTIYEIVEPNATKIIKQQNMGFIDTQAARSSCQITDLIVIP